MKKTLLVIGCVLALYFLYLVLVGAGQSPTISSVPVVAEKYSGKNLNYEISHYAGSNRYSVVVIIGQPNNSLTFSDEAVGIYEARKIVDEAWDRYFIQCRRPVPKR